MPMRDRLKVMVGTPVSMSVENTSAVVLLGLSLVSSLILGGLKKMSVRLPAGEPSLLTS